MDIIIKKKLCKEEIIDLLSQVYQVEKNSVLVKNNIFETEIPADIEVFCEPYSVDWEFKTRLDVYTKRENGSKEELLRNVGEISKILKCEVLIDDCTNNPYTMLKVERISIDMDKLDEAHEYDDNKIN